MGTYRIAVVVGSLRKDSFNRKLATALARLAPADFAFQQVRIDDLPLYNQDDDGAPAEAVRRFKAEIAGAQGVQHVHALDDLTKNRETPVQVGHGGVGDEK